MRINATNKTIYVRVCANCTTPAWSTRARYVDTHTHHMQMRKQSVLLLCCCVLSILPTVYAPLPPSDPLPTPPDPLNHAKSPPQPPLPSTSKFTVHMVPASALRTRRSLSTTQNASSTSPHSGVALIMFRADTSVLNSLIDQLSLLSECQQNATRR